MLPRIARKRINYIINYINEPTGIRTLIPPSEAVCPGPLDYRPVIAGLVLLIQLLLILQVEARYLILMVSILPVQIINVCIKL